MLSAGYQHCQPGYAFDGYQRGELPFGIIQYTTAGCGMLSYEGHHYDVPAGSCMVLTVPHAHHYHLPTDGTWEHVYCRFAGAFGLSILQELIEVNGPVWPCATQKRFLDLLGQLVWKTAYQPASALELSASLYQLLSSALTADRERQSPQIAQLENFIHDHLSEPIGVPELAAQLSMSRAHFTRWFAEQTGVSPGQHLLNLRLQHAKELIAQNYSSEAIAEACGFANANYWQSLQATVWLHPWRF